MADMNGRRGRLLSSYLILLYHVTPRQIVENDVSGKLTQSIIWKIDKGQTRPGYETVKRIADSVTLLRPDLSDEKGFNKKVYLKIQEIVYMINH